MNDDFLKIRLQRVVRRYQWLAVWRTLAVCWASAALLALGVGWMQSLTGHVIAWALPGVVGLALTVGVALVVRQLRSPPAWRWVAQKIEAKHPELNGLVLTAVQTAFAANGEQSYLQYRVLQEATARSQEQDWREIVPGIRLWLGATLHWAALGLLISSLGYFRVATIHGETAQWVGTDGIAVTPGDTSVEKGDSLVVLARFKGALPPLVSLVLRDSGAARRTIPLVKSLADPVFGGSVPEVASDFTYRLEYRGQSTREFKVTVFEHPRLVRSDVDLRFPDYTQLPPKHIEDTRRVSAVEGTKMDFALQLNKPVKSARLVSRDGQKTVIALTVVAGQAVANLQGHVPEKSRSYDLQLVDAEGRANKVAAPFVIEVLPNRPPEVRIASPRGDVRPSALEELAFEGTAWDDFGLKAFGLAYTVAGRETKIIELGREGAPKEKRPLAHLLRLEELGVKPDDLISWYAWADDIGPDGKVRRTSGDLYFAEVRPFDEIFRESQNMDSEDEESPPGEARNSARKLAELQKQIISATWKLQRESVKPTYGDDAKVVLESQQQALSQAEESQEEARAPRQQAMWKVVTVEMVKAIEKLKEAASTVGPLAQALPAEQAAYQGLLKMQARETQVSRRNSKKGGGGGQAGNQRQIDQLDLKQSENRYETQRQAKSPQNQERREQLAVMNRLQELARRQNDINEKMQELQTALQEAKTDQQREDIKRRLKRLEEDQRQMLADADEVRQRMDRAENQSQMAPQRQQLDQTREDIQKAADAAADGSVAQALASGTRAQRQLQEMRDELRKQNSSQFADDLREMRNEARDLARQQDEISQQMDSQGNGAAQKAARKTLTDTDDRKEMLDKLTEQKTRMDNLVQRATQVSEQAENTEPLVSRQLYDSIRKVSQDDASAVKQVRDELLAGGRMTRDLYDRLQKTSDREGGGKALDVTREMLKEGYLPQARQAGQRARGEIEDLKRGVERAAESVLGDDAEQLRLARSELDQLTDQLQREIAQAGEAGKAAAGTTRGGEPGAGEGRASGEKGAEAGQPNEGKGAAPVQIAAEGEPAGEGSRPDSAQKGGSGKQVAKSDAQGKAAGQGKSPGQGKGPGQGQSPGAGGGQAGEASTQAGAPGEGSEGQAGDARVADGRNNAQGQGKARGANGPRQTGGVGAEVNRSRGQGASQAGDERGGRGGGVGFGLDDLLDGRRESGRVGEGRIGGVRNAAPLTGEDFARWNERLRDVEDIVETPELRKALAEARERARLLRRDFRQDAKKPDWTVVELKILKPLVEVRSRLAEELARRESKDSLTPIDRDPVPGRFAESVRRYYEELGKDK